MTGLENIRIFPLTKKILLHSLPVATSYTSHIFYEFIDLLFLASYSEVAFAAIFPSFVVYWNLLVLFTGTAGYIRVMMAGEIVNENPRRVGQLLWLGMSVGVLGGGIFLGLFSYSEQIFAWIGHPPEVQAQEILYYDMMCFTVFFQIARTSFEAYYLAIGRPIPIFVIYTISILINILMAWLLIYGIGWFPELGIAGAGSATLISSIAAFILHLVYALYDKRARFYGILALHYFSKADMGRLVRIGVPSALEKFLEELVWTVLILMVGRAGVLALSLSNVAINILEFAYRPMIALGDVLAVEIAKFSTLRLHKHNRDLVKAISIAVGGYIILWLVGLLGFSDMIAQFYFGDFSFAQDKNYHSTLNIYFLILSFCIVCGCFYYVFNAVLVAMDDTLFPLIAMIVSFILVILVPAYLVLIIYHGSFLWGWALFGTNITLLALINGARFFTRNATLIYHSHDTFPARP